MAFLRIEDVELWYEEHGPADAPAIVLVHGYSASSGMWAFQREPLSERHRLITLDVRGHGRTVSVGRERFDLRVFARDVIGLLDHLGVRRAHVVGLSMGGMIAIELGFAFPERVATMTLCDTVPGRLPVPLLGLMHLLPVAARIPRARALLGSRLAPGTSPMGAQVAEVTRSVNDHVDKGAMLRASSAIAWKRDRTRAIRGFAFPTQIVVGADDLLLNGSLVIRRELPGACLAVLEKCGHGTAVLRPRTFNHVVLDFLARVGAGGPFGTTRVYPKRPRTDDVSFVAPDRPLEARGYLEDSWRAAMRVAPMARALVTSGARALAR
jgi:3-oxoadipate enol-lactonase